MFEYLVFSLLILGILNLLLKKKNILLHNSFGFKHKEPKIKNIVLSGGIFFVTSFIIISFFNNFIFMNYFFFVLFFLILGILSDVNFKISPQQRLLVMLIISFFIIINAQLFIDNVGIKLLDIFLQINIFSIIFSSLCIVILVNGTNFIDGKNGNVVAYYFLCFISLIYQLNLIEEANVEAYILQLMSLPLIIFYVFNLLNRNYLGDNGSYFLSSVTALITINLFINYDISAFYLINLFLYPIIEVLVSFVRKIYNKSSPYSPDKLHLHHLIGEIVLKNKFLKKYENNISSLIITIILFLFFIQINLDINDKLAQIKLTSIFCFMYIFVYFLTRVLLDKTALKKK